MMEMPIQFRDPVRLALRRRRLVYGVGTGLWLSGVLWLVFHYFMRREGEFGPMPNPLEHWWLVAHGLFAFMALWLFGLLWGQHIAGAWRTGRSRISGWFLFGVLAVLIASGYLLYYAGGDETRSIVSPIHWIVGLALPLPFLVHRFFKAIPQTSRAPEPDGESGSTEGLV